MTTKSLSHFNAGHIVKVFFPFAEGEGGKTRPVLLVTDPNNQGDFIAVGITTAQHHDNCFALAATDLAQGKMNLASYVRADKIFTFNVESITQTYGVVKQPVLDKAKRLMCPSIGCK